MDELIIRKTSFEEKKEHLKYFANDEAEDPIFEKVPTTGGLFYLFDHSVTGDEINKLVEQIQEQFVHANERDKKIIEEFHQVYETFDSLDKEYINGIVVGLEAADRAAKENGETLALMQETLRQLKEFKAEKEEIIQECVDKMNDYKKRENDLVKRVYFSYIMGGIAIFISVICMIMTMGG